MTFENRDARLRGTGVHLHRGNRAEDLAQALATVVAEPLADPTAPEWIVVEGRGMERWLSLQLARELGIWANAEFPFPRKLVEAAFDAALGGATGNERRFAPENLMWSIAALLPGCVSRPAFAALRGYLQNDEEGRELLQLAQRIASVFDQYVVYRPEMLREWERGATAAESPWQAELWRMLVREHGPQHLAARAERFFEAARRPAFSLGGFPARLGLFGLSTLAPLFVRVLGALGAVVEVHLFVLSPTPEWWADLRSPREQMRETRRGRAARRDGGALPAAAPVDAADAGGSRLLVSLGRVGRDFQQLVEEELVYVDAADDVAADPGSGTMLATLQSDIFRLQSRGRAGTVEALRLDPEDDSIRVHACHGPMREVEVLHDRLRDLFDRFRDLEPRDVIVMSADIDAYAPYVDAVFGAEEGGRIPYAIADRRRRDCDDVAAAFLRLLGVLRGRVKASEVLDLLRAECVGARFGIAAEELELVGRWVGESGIRWGVDAAHRASVGQPAREENTWRFGLDRLFLGYAMSDDETRLFGGVRPYDDIEGTTTTLLGRLGDFCSALFRAREEVAAARRLDAWRDALLRLLSEFVTENDDNAPRHQTMREGIASLAESAAAGGFTDAIGFAAVCERLAAALADPIPGRNFLSGGVTFCALLPMRSLPFRVVCLLGMNEESFPRRARPAGFDLMARKRRPGDRSPRDDDRQLFLEALLSARERLLITYVGQSAHDNAELPPSVVVSELIEALEQSFVPVAFAGNTPATVREQVVVRHPLQAFSPSCFGASGDARLFSYAAHSFDGARAMADPGPRADVAPFVSGALTPQAGPGVPSVDLEDLVRFFENPAREFAENGLGLFLREDGGDVDDDQPLGLGGLDAWKVGSALLERVLKGEGIEASVAAVRAGGLLPVGTPGVCAFAEMAARVQCIAKGFADQRLGDRLQPLRVDLDVGGVRLFGVLDRVWRAGQGWAEVRRLGAKVELGLWIRHLVFNCVAPPAALRRSVLVGRDEEKAGVVAFRPVQDAAQFLGELVGLYQIGRVVPLPFFPGAALAYAETMRGENSTETAFAAARKKYGGNDYAGGDQRDAYASQVFRGVDPLAPDYAIALAEGKKAPSFAAIAATVFAPLLEHREDSR